MKEALSLQVDVLDKARLFDAMLEKEEHLSKSRIIRFLVEQTHWMEETADRMRGLVDSVIPEFQPERGPLTTPMYPETRIPEATPPPIGGFPEDRSTS